MLVDSHTHVSLVAYEPVEMLLNQMHYNGVEKAVLVQTRYDNFDNGYVIESMRRFPGRFSVICRVDVKSPNALADLERWQREGAEALRLRNFDRSPGSDPLAIWRKAQDLGMSVCIGGSIEKFSDRGFTSMIEQLPKLKFVFEHLAGMGLFASGNRVRPTDAEFNRQIVQLASYPNTYIKIHGMGEFCQKPYPYKDIPPYVKMAYDAFGPQRMMWGSTFPSVVMREGYRNALRFTMAQLTFCSPDDLAWIFGKTALSMFTFPDR